MSKDIILHSNLATLANAVELCSTAAARLAGTDEVTNNVKGSPITKALIADTLVAKIQRKLAQKAGV